MASLFIPQGYLASDNDAAAKIRASLAKDLKEGKPVEIASSGDVMGQNGEQKKLVTQPGKLAADNVFRTCIFFDRKYHVTCYANWVNSIWVLC